MGGLPQAAGGRRGGLSLRPVRPKPPPVGDRAEGAPGDGVEFVSLHEGVDTSTPNGRLVFGIFASIAEFERELIRSRYLPPCSY
jgi:hypothetical protein